MDFAMKDRRVWHCGSEVLSIKIIIASILSRVQGSGGGWINWGANSIDQVGGCQRILENVRQKNSL